MTEITLTKQDLHGGRVTSIPNWETIPDGAVFVKKDDNTLKFVEPIEDGEIVLADITSFTTEAGVIVSVTEVTP